MVPLNSSNGIVCPRLQDLTWTMAFCCSLPFYRLFISPHLTTFSFQYQYFRGRALDEILSNLTSMFVKLRTSSFQSLEVYLNIDTPDLKSAVSSAILRCGSSLTTFYGLVHLILGSPCSSRGGCAFGLTDDDIAEVATALHNLVNAVFGSVCAANSCRTTLSSFLFLSTRCKNLEFLEVHFNTTNLRDNIQFV